MAITPEAIDPATGPWPEHQLVVVFETFEQARAARDRLVDEGISTSDMDLLSRDEMTGQTESHDGVWASIRRFFVPEEDAHAYAEGISRGQAVLAVRPPAGEREHVVRVLESFEPIDFDARLEEWRAEGWNGRSDLLPTGPATMPQPALDVATRPGIAATAGQVPGGTRGAMSETIPVVEEDVRIGKRVVDQGGVRVRSYVRERPVTEDVNLRDERVEVERRPVDRPVDVPADAFRERTIEAKAYGEEPVVQKDARVVEEIGIRKDATERTERVEETARKTEVEVEDTRGKKPGA